MRRRGNEITWNLQCGSQEELAKVKLFTTDTIKNDGVYTVVSSSYLNGNQVDRSRSYKLSEFIESMAVSPCLEDNSIKFVFRLRKAVDPFWKDAMVIFLHSILHLGNVSVKSITRSA